MYDKVCAAETEFVVLQNAHQTRTATPLQPGDQVWCWVGGLKADLSKKLQVRWIGPWRVHKIMQSLVTIVPAGDWAKRPRPLTVRLNRVVRVDPRQASSGFGRPAASEKLDLEDLAGDLEDAEAVIRVLAPEAQPATAVAGAGTPSLPEPQVIEAEEQDEAEENESSSPPLLPESIEAGQDREVVEAEPGEGECPPPAAEGVRNEAVQPAEMAEAAAPPQQGAPRRVGRPRGATTRRADPTFVPRRNPMRACRVREVVERILALIRFRARK